MRGRAAAGACGARQSAVHDRVRNQEVFGRLKAPLGFQPVGLVNLSRVRVEHAAEEQADYQQNYCYLSEGEPRLFHGTTACPAGHDPSARCIRRSDVIV